MSILNRIELAEHITRAKNLVYSLLPVGASIDTTYHCKFWNTHVLKNCTVSTPGLTQVQDTIVASMVMGDPSVCTLCPVGTQTSCE